MPTPGFALIGFMDQHFAVEYLQSRCVPANRDPQILLAEWADARARLGKPVENFGRPDIQDLPSDVLARLLPLVQTQSFAEVVGRNTWAFKMVEIDPLLAFQFQVDTSHAESLCQTPEPGASIERLVDICLPTSPELIPYQLAALQNGVLIRTPSLNLRLLRSGAVGDDAGSGSDSGAPGSPGRAVRDVVVGGRAQAHFAGIGFGPGMRLVQVARFDGRCYLRNGFHRAYGLRRAGATHVPCLLLDVPTFAEIGAIGLPATFSESLLRSDDPPTCGHCTQGRAHPVRLRKLSRIIQVTWSECIIPDE